MEAPIAGYQDFTQELSTLISTYPPPFIYIYDPIAPRTTSSVIKATISERETLQQSGDFDIYGVHFDATTCFTQRLLFDAILNALLNLYFTEEPTERWNDSWDSFLHGLRHLHSQKRKESPRDIRFVVCIEHAHKLKDKLPQSIIPLTRLSELVSHFLLPIF